MGSNSNYDDWQLTRIRNALNMFGLFETDADGKPLSFGGIAPAIKDYTGYEIHEDKDRAYEIVRRFVKGNQIGETGVYSVTNPPWASYAVEFLTHPEVAYLSEYELEVKESDFRAAIYLSEFFNSNDPDTNRLKKIKRGKPAHRYEYRRNLPSEFMVVELILDRYLQDDIYKATIIENYYQPGIGENFDDWDSLQRFEEREAYYVLDGWAVHSPENELIFYTKSGKGENMAFSTLSGFKTENRKQLSNVLTVKKIRSLIPPVENERFSILDMKKEHEDDFGRSVMVFRLLPQEGKTLGKVAAELFGYAE